MFKNPFRKPRRRKDGGDKPRRRERVSGFISRWAVLEFYCGTILTSSAIEILSRPRTTYTVIMFWVMLACGLAAYSAAAIFIGQAWKRRRSRKALGGRLCSDCVTVILDTDAGKLPPGFVLAYRPPANPQALVVVENDADMILAETVIPDSPEGIDGIKA